MNSNIDLDKVHKMRTILKDNFKTTLDSFLNDADGYIGEIEKQAGGGDLKKSQDAAHKLKSSAGLFGIINVHQLAEKIERQTNNVDDIKPLLNNLKETFEESKKILKELE